MKSSRDPILLIRDQGEYPIWVDHPKGQNTTNRYGRKDEGKKGKIRYSQNRKVKMKQTHSGKSLKVFVIQLK